MDVNFSSISLSGYSEDTDHFAIMNLTGGTNDIAISAGSTTLGPNALLEMARADSSQVQVSFNAGNLVLEGDDSGNARVVVGKNTSLLATNLSMSSGASDTVEVMGSLTLTGTANTVEKGKITVSGGVLNLNSLANLIVTSNQASLQMAGLINFADDSAITLRNQGVMNIVDGSTANGAGTINNESGVLTITHNLNAAGTTILSSSTTNINIGTNADTTVNLNALVVSDGTTTVEKGVALTANTVNVSKGDHVINGSENVGVFSQTGGTTTVAAGGALVVRSALNASGGIIDVNGTVSGLNASVSGATVNINTGGSMTFDQYSQTGGTTTVAGGALVANAALAISGGSLNVSGTDAATRGSVTTNAATVSGTATVNVNGYGRFSATTYDQTGGRTNVAANGVLAVADSLGISGGEMVVAGTVDALTADTTVSGTNATVSINLGGQFNTNSYNQTGGAVTVATGGALVSSTTLNLVDGRLAVAGSASGKTMTQTGGEVTIQSGGDISISQAIDIQDGDYTVENGGSVGGGSYSQSGGNVLVATGGNLTIAGESVISDGSFTVSGTAAMATLTQSGGTVHVGIGGVLTSTGRIAVQDGDFTVSGTVDGHDFTQSGGTVDVAAGGVLNADGTLTLQDGVATVTGTVNAVNVVSRSDDVIIENGGKIVATTGFTVADGEVVVDEGGTLDVSAGRLTVSGGVLDLSGAATADDMTFSGGEVNLRDNGTLAVTNAVTNARGTLHMYGGTATFTAGIEFTAGGVVNHHAGSEIESALLTIAANARLDVSEAGMRVSGDLVLAGTYSIDYDAVSGTLNMVDLIGSLDVKQTVKVAFTQEVVDYVVDQGGAVRILASDGLMDGVTAGNFPNSYRYSVYAYYLSLVDDSDNAGLYIDRMRILELDELRQYMIDDWNQHRDVRGYAENIINGDLVNAVLKGSLDYSDPDVKLSYAGTENAHNLFNLGEGPVNSSYSALMLYNGAGLAAVNQAHLATGGQILDVLGGRMGLLRNGPTSIATCEDAFGKRILEPADRFGNRIWASGFGAEQSLKWKDGFAGYKYRPYGVSVGFDRDFGGLVLGVAASYVNGKYEDHAAEKNDSRISALSGSLYGMYRHQETGLFLGGSVGIVRFDNDLRDMRTMRNNLDALSRGWNSADYNASGWLAHGRLGYDMRFGGNFTVTPSVGIRHVYAESDSHRQNFRPLDGSAEYNTLVAGKVDNHSTTVPFELSFNYNFIGEEDAVLSVFGSVGYAYELNEDAVKGSVTYGGLASYPAIAIVGRTTDRDVLMAGLGMNYIYDRYELSVDYRLTARDKYYTHYVNGLVSVKF